MFLNLDVMDGRVWSLNKRHFSGILVGLCLEVIDGPQVVHFLSVLYCRIV